MTILEEIKQMNKEKFRENLIKTIEEISKKKGLTFTDCKFVIEPVKEKDKPRFRKPTLLRNTETGHAPFNTIV